MGRKGTRFVFSGRGRSGWGVAGGPHATHEICINLYCEGAYLQPQMPQESVKFEEAVLERLLAGPTDVEVSVHHNLLNDGRHSAIAYITYPDNEDKPVPIPDPDGWNIKMIELLQDQCAVTLLQVKDGA